LFALIEGNGTPGGGPRCTDFMDRWLNWNPVTPILNATGAPLPEPSTEFLSIPREEHRAGAIAVSALRERLDGLADPGIRARFIRLGRDYLFLLSQHIEKEEECLFPLAKRLLT